MGSPSLLAMHVLSMPDSRTGRAGRQLFSSGHGAGPCNKYWHVFVTKRRLDVKNFFREFVPKRKNSGAKPPGRVPISPIRANTTVGTRAFGDRSRRGWCDSLESRRNYTYMRYGGYTNGSRPPLYCAMGSIPQRAAPLALGFRLGLRYR